MSRVTKHDRDMADAREKLYQLREKVLGPFHDSTRHWTETLPEHPASARERFLQICATGGAVCFEAALKGLVLRPLNIRNEWLAQSTKGHNPAEPGDYQLHLWIRPKPYGDLFGRQHTAQHCDAELHDSWNRVKVGRTRRRTGRVIYRGRVSDCLDHAKQLFTVWEATARLGGQAESLVLF